MAREERPANDQYYETRLPLLSQGDIFRDVPLAYPIPADRVVEDESSGERLFLAGPFEIGLAMLTTPTCSMRAQGAEAHDYAHPVRTLVPVLPLTEGLMASLKIDSGKLGLLRKYDGLINYMYVPPDDDLELEESLALLYMPVTLHHAFIEGQRITQLAREAAKHLHKLTWFSTGWLESRELFDPPMD
jgi:hypothetical protein